MRWRRHWSAKHGKSCSRIVKKPGQTRMAAQHAADEKARQAANYARLLRKEAAEQAEAELYKAKADTLHRLLIQVAESRALGT